MIGVFFPIFPELQLSSHEIQPNRLFTKRIVEIHFSKITNTQFLSIKNNSTIKVCDTVEDGQLN